jgi:hypothetical protein
VQQQQRRAGELTVHLPTVGAILNDDLVVPLFLASAYRLVKHHLTVPAAA